MAKETIGRYQLHLIARQVSGSGKWAPYLVIERFDDSAGDFKLVLETQRVAGDAEFDTEEAAEEAARQHGNILVREGRV